MFILLFAFQLWWLVMLERLLERYLGLSFLFFSFFLFFCDFVSVVFARLQLFLFISFVLRGGPTKGRAW